MQTKRERVNAATLAMLDEALPKLRESADLNGLLRAQALAQAVATTSDGAVRRKAIRIVKKAGAAGTKLDEGARAATARRDAWTPAGFSSADRRHDDAPVTPNTEAPVEQDSYVPEDSLDVPEDGLRLGRAARGRRAGRGARRVSPDRGSGSRRRLDIRRGRACERLEWSGERIDSLRPERRRGTINARPDGDAPDSRTRARPTPDRSCRCRGGRSERPTHRR